MTVLLKTLAVAMLASGVAGAQGGRLPRAGEVAKNPDAFKSREIWIEAAGCVDPGGAGFVCTKQIAGQILVVRGLALGPLTSFEIVEALISRCKGTANLGRRDCRMNVLLTVDSVERDVIDAADGSMRRTVLNAGVIEFSRPSR